MTENHKKIIGPVEVSDTYGVTTFNGASIVDKPRKLEEFLALQSEIEDVHKVTKGHSIFTIEAACKKYPALNQMIEEIFKISKGGYKEITIDNSTMEIHRGSENFFYAFWVEKLILVNDFRKEKKVQKKRILLTC